MYKVLIVDDEMLVRMGLKSSIEWEKYGFEIINEASNGQKAMELIEKNTPDILITDIKMPIMDGITLIEQAIKRFPHIKALVLSNYNDFDLVREAMKKGALDYLLKVTIDSEQLLKSLNYITEKIDQEQVNIKSNADEVNMQEYENRYFLRNQFIYGLIESSANEDFISEKIHKLGLKVNLNKGSIFFITFVNYSEELINKFARDSNHLNSAVISLIDELSNSNSQGEVFSLGQGIYIAIFSDRLDSNREILLSEQIMNSLKALLEIRVKIHIGLHYSNYEEFKNILQKKDEVLQLGFYEEQQCIIPSKENYFQKAQFNNLYVDIKKDIETYLQFCDYDNLEGLVKSFLINAKKQKMEPNCLKEVLFTMINLIKDSLKKENNKFDNINILKSLQSFTSYEAAYNYSMGLVEDIIMSFDQSNYQKYKKEILQVYEYVEKHYSDKITLEDIAKDIAINKSYLSRLFKKETGQVFQNYLIKFRMDKAADHILKSNKRITDIAFEVGFNDIFYFNRVFKKIYNMSPSEYKKMNEGN